MKIVRMQLHAVTQAHVYGGLRLGDSFDSLFDRAYSLQDAAAHRPDTLYLPRSDLGMAVASAKNGPAR